jgi:Mlc titration factor MtfA (ptsG expression regulator)
MNPWIFLFLVLAAIALALWIPRYRLKRAIAGPFPDEWVNILEHNIEIYPNLPMPLRHQIRLMIKQFLHQKHFSGAGGLEITDEMRITIAAQACLLQLNRNSGLYPGLKYIIVYPSTFVVTRSEMDGSGVVSHGRKGMLGESWQNGKVILAWDNVLHGAAKTWCSTSSPTSLTAKRAARMVLRCWRENPVTAVGRAHCRGNSWSCRRTPVLEGVH